MATYQLKGDVPASKINSALSTPAFDDKILLSNSKWFISVRWIVIIIFIISGIIGGLFAEYFAGLGFIAPVRPLLFMASLLIPINIFFYIFDRKVHEDNHRGILTILWVQIIIDLIFITTLVYFVGSTCTYIPFIYLIHIALSCIFFSKSRSIIVVVIAATLYIACVIFQDTGILPQQTSVIAIAGNKTWPPLTRFLFALSAVFIWIILWYFISTLSDALRESNSSLRTANQELKLADIEKTRQVLITTHDLKAPFAGIESNIGVMKHLHWDELPDSCRVLLDKIEVRSKTLRERIKQILDLGNLRTQINNDIQVEPISLKKVFDSVLSDIADQILERKIELITDIADITVNSNKEKLEILFSNLVSNAVFYTPQNGEIDIIIEKHFNHVDVIIKDTGIGIAEEYLDKIFNEYFMTPEAKRFNKMSTGLGLQIVKTISEQLELSISVESEKNIGTTFTVKIKL